MIVYIKFLLTTNRSIKYGLYKPNMSRSRIFQSSVWHHWAAADARSRISHVTSASDSPLGVAMCRTSRKKNVFKFLILYCTIRGVGKLKLLLLYWLAMRLFPRRSFTYVRLNIYIYFLYMFTDYSFNCGAILKIIFIFDRAKGTLLWIVVVAQ